MSSFSYFSKALVAAAGEAAVNHIRRLSEEEDEKNNWSPFKNELNFRLAALGGGLVTMLVVVGIMQLLQTCCDYLPSHQASRQPAPCRRILPVMSIEPAVNFTSGLTLAGGADHPDCTICLSEFVEDDEIRIISYCRHGFHKKCIETWMLSQSSCPICRNSSAETSVNQNPPENQQQQQQPQPNDVDLEAANPPEIEMMVLQQQ